MNLKSVGDFYNLCKTDERIGKEVINAVKDYDKEKTENNLKKILNKIILIAKQNGYDLEESSILEYVKENSNSLSMEDLKLVSGGASKTLSAMVAAATFFSSVVPNQQVFASEQDCFITPVSWQEDQEDQEYTEVKVCLAELGYRSSEEGDELDEMIGRFLSDREDTGDLNSDLRLYILGDSDTFLELLSNNDQGDNKRLIENLIGNEDDTFFATFFDTFFRNKENFENLKENYTDLFRYFIIKASKVCLKSLGYCSSLESVRDKIIEGFLEEKESPVELNDDLKLYILGDINILLELLSNNDQGDNERLIENLIGNEDDTSFKKFFNIFFESFGFIREEYPGFLNLFIKTAILKHPEVFKQMESNAQEEIAGTITEGIANEEIIINFEDKEMTQRLLWNIPNLLEVLTRLDPDIIDGICESHSEEFMKWIVDNRVFRNLFRLNQEKLVQYFQMWIEQGDESITIDDFINLIMNNLDLCEDGNLHEFLNFLLFQDNEDVESAFYNSLDDSKCGTLLERFPDLINKFCEYYNNETLFEIIKKANEDTIKNVIDVCPDVIIYLLDNFPEKAYAALNALKGEGKLLDWIIKNNMFNAIWEKKEDLAKEILGLFCDDEEKLLDLLHQDFNIFLIFDTYNKERASAVLKLIKRDVDFKKWIIENPEVFKFFIQQYPNEAESLIPAINKHEFVTDDQKRCFLKCLRENPDLFISLFAIYGGEKLFYTRELLLSTIMDNYSPFANNNRVLAEIIYCYREDLFVIEGMKDSYKGFMLNNIAETINSQPENSFQDWLFAEEDYFLDIIENHEDLASKIIELIDKESLYSYALNRFDIMYHLIKSEKLGYIAGFVVRKLIEDGSLNEWVKINGEQALDLLIENQNKLGIGSEEEINGQNLEEILGELKETISEEDED